MKSRPLVIAHRGYSAKYPENTMSAFNKAVEYKADMIEFDVHLSKDKKICITHDYELGRTCNGSGLLDNYTFDQLQELDFGSWFNSSFTHEKIPELSDLLKLSMEFNISLNLEVKHQTLHENAVGIDTMCKQLKKYLENYSLSDSLIVSSFSYDFLKEFRLQMPNIKIGILNHYLEKDLHLNLVDELKAYSYHPNFKSLNSEYIKLIKDKGLKIFPYTANTESDFEKLRSLGVDGIITNEVSLLLEYLS